MGAVASSASPKDEGAETEWLVEHRGFGSPWSQFALRRYGAGFSATGVSASVCLPRLLRRRLQDWGVQGLDVSLGRDFVSFGRKLESRSRNNVELFFGTHIYFGDHTDRASWIWYCRPHEWLLQLHKAVLEPLPAALPTFRPLAAEQRWPGQPRFLVEDTQASGAGVGDARNVGKAALGKSQFPASEGAVGKSQFSVSEDEADFVDTDAHAEEDDIVDHQLSLFLGNADGHVGLLVLPVPRNRVTATAAVVAKWNEACGVPLEWAGRSWSSAEDFTQLREAAFNMPDILLLGLETELAMALTPDWTWEKYPRGFGDAAFPNTEPSDVRDYGTLLGTPPTHAGNRRTIGAPRPISEAPIAAAA